MRGKVIFALNVFLALLIAGCSREGPGHEPSGFEDEGVVAVYRAGLVTEEDIDEAILQHPEGQRPSGDELTAQLVEELIHRIVAERLLLEAGMSPEADADPEVLWDLQWARRNVLVQAYLRRQAPYLEQPSEEELRQVYEDNRAGYSREAKRLVTHLFIRRPSEGDPGLSRERAEELRKRVLAGENLSLLAREHSDSESRHRDGSLGWVRRGQFPETLEAIIFDLKEGVPSPAMVTAEGVHLFLVEESVEGKQFSFEEIRETVRSRWLEDRSREAMRRLVEQLPPVVDLWVVDKNEIWSVVQARRGGSTVLRAGEFEVSEARFLRMLAESRNQMAEDVDPEEHCLRVLEDLEAGEKIYVFALASGLDQDAEVRRALDRAETRVRVAHGRKMTLRHMLSSRKDLVERYFEDNVRRFSTPLRLRLRRFRFTLDEVRGHELMSRLEEAVAELDGGAASARIQDLAVTRGAQVDELGWVGIHEIARVMPVLARTVANLEAGRFSPPQRVENAIHLVEVLERREPEIRPLESVLPAVQAAYLADNQASLLEIWKTDIFLEVELIIDASRVEALLSSRSPG